VLREFDSSGARLGEAPPATAGRERRRIALFLHNLEARGAEVSMLRAAGRLVELGHKVDLVLCEAKGALLEQVPPGVEVVTLKPGSQLWARGLVVRADPAGLAAYARAVVLPRKPPHRLRYLAGLARYLRKARPDGLISALTNANLLAVWARRLTGVPVRLVVSHRNTLSESIRDAGGGTGSWRQRYLPEAVRRGYAQADAIAVVSNGVGADLARTAGLRREAITTVYNPVMAGDIDAKARAAVDHPFFAPGEPPVVLGVGALIEQKDFATLVRAFARLRGKRRARLVILGEGRKPEETAAARRRLTELAEALGVAADVAFPGFVANPYAFMARAAVFVLSSRFEGLPGVLIQALACGCPAVSTDCPHGPREILEDGRFGRLVPMDDAAAMAAAIEATLDDPPPRKVLRERGAMFSVERAVDAYLDLLWPGSSAPQKRLDPNDAQPRKERAHAALKGAAMGGAATDARTVSHDPL